MTALTSVRIICNGAEPSGTGCLAVVEGGEQPDGSWVFPRTAAEARKLAKSRGWLHVRWAGYRRVVMHYDYCPAHDDQAQARAGELGVKVIRPKTAPEAKPQSAAKES